MINIVGHIPKKNFGIAVSGGIDSMTVLDFLLNSHRKPTVFHFNHGTDHAKKAEDFVTKFCKTNDLELIKGKINRSRNNDESKEEYWRNLRYQFLHSYSTYDIIAAQHLNDCLETWLFSTFHGKAKTIPYRFKNVFRPFLLTKRESLKHWAVAHNVKWIEDESNVDLKYCRNRIRHNIIPEIMEINPGIHKHIARIIKRKLKNELGEI